MYITDRMVSIGLDKDNILLINTISSAFDIVNSETYGKIIKIKAGEQIQDHELINTLKSRGYIFEDKTSEVELIEKYVNINQKLIKRNSIHNFVICPTMGCNLRCTYCFESNNSLNSTTIMSDGQLLSIFNFIDNHLELDLNSEEKSYTAATISIFGGEPLLPANKKIIKKILEFAKERKMEVRIVTNGTTIKYFYKLLMSYDNVIIQITLDGAKPIHDTRRIGKTGIGTFDLIVSNVDLLIKVGIRTNLRTNINQDNIDSLPELISFIREKGWVESGYVYPYVSPVLDYCDGVNNSMKESELYSRVLEIEPMMGSEESIIKMVGSPCVNYLHRFFDTEQKFKPWKISYCEATSGCNFIFSPYGDITTCLMLAGNSVHQIGYFDERSVKINPVLDERWSNRTVLRISKCSECKFALICGGGCPVASIDINEDIDCPVCSDIENTIIAFVEHNKQKILQRI